MVDVQSKKHEQTPHKQVCLLNLNLLTFDHTITKLFPMEFIKFPAVIFRNQPLHGT